MKFRTIPLFILFAVLSATALAQVDIDPGYLALRLTSPVSTMARTPLFASESNESAPTAAIQGLEQQAFQLLNEKRAEIGLLPLTWNDDVARLARMHSRNMAGYKFFSHKDLDGKFVDDRAESIGLGNWKAIGENIAFLRGYKDPVETAVNDWMHSAAHRQNVLNERWNQSAVGVAVAADGSYYFTQVFMVR